VNKITKKVVLFIVEGPTDETTLKPLLKKIINDKKIFFKIVRGDITSQRGIYRRNAINKVNTLIEDALNEDHLFKDDFFVFSI